MLQINLYAVVPQLKLIIIFLFNLDGIPGLKEILEMENAQSMALKQFHNT